MDEVSTGHADPFIVLEDVVLYRPGGEPCPPISWQIEDDQHWAIVGPNGSGKSTLARALGGRTPVAGGRIVYNLAHNGSGRAFLPHERIAYVDFEAQRAFTGRESPFYQARWNSVGSIDVPSVADYLSERGARGFNPYRVAVPQLDPGRYLADRERVVALLGIERLLGRRIVEISSGERRKVLLARALLQGPELLILDNPFAGLDQDFRARLRGIIEDLTRDTMRVIVVVAIGEDIPPGITHVLVMDGGRLLAQGSRPADGVVAGLPDVIPGEPNCPRVIPNGARRSSVILNGAKRSEKSDSHDDEIFRGAQNDRVEEKASLRSGQDGRLSEEPGPVLVGMEDVTVSYDGVPVLQGINWTIRQGERWALVGPNGAGKTTLLSLILGDNPQAYANRITLFGRRRGTGESIWEIKQQTGWVAPELHLYYPRAINCLDVVCSGFFDSVGLYRRCSPEQRQTAVAWMARLAIGSLAERAFCAVSEGQQRLVLLARAVVKEPALLVLDEPCQGLDAAHRERVLRTVDAIGKETEASLIYVTHDPVALPGSITHVLQLEAGRVARRGAMIPARDRFPLLRE